MIGVFFLVRTSSCQSEIEEIPYAKLDEAVKRPVLKTNLFTEPVIIETLELLGVSLKPEDYINRGNDLFYKKDYESALKAYDKAIELKPDNDIALSNRGTVLGKLGRYNEAIEIYDNAIELKPDFAISWFERARIYSLMGNKQNAISDLEKAIEHYAILKDSAKIDEDFKNLWDDEDFKKLVE